MYRQDLLNNFGLGLLDLDFSNFEYYNITLSRFDFVDFERVGGNASVFGKPLYATITGTPGDDVLMGTNFNDEIRGLGGNDTINGGIGDDILYGDQGADILAGGGGNDSLYDGDGDDIVYGFTGDDQFYVEGGNNTLDGGDGIDTANFSGNLSEYTIVINVDGSISVTEIAGSGFVNILTNIEFIQFADQPIVLSSVSAETNILLDDSFDFVDDKAIIPVSEDLVFDLEVLGMTKAELRAVFMEALAQDVYVNKANAAEAIDIPDFDFAYDMWG